MSFGSYDTDITTWNPEGRIMQLEYASAAIDLGSACVALKTKEVVVLACLKRQPHKLAFHQEKVFKIDEHCAMGFSGLPLDAYNVSTQLRDWSRDYVWKFGSPPWMKMMIGTWLYEYLSARTRDEGSRPAAFGGVFVGYDGEGPQIWSASPDGDVHQCYAYAIGKRGASARTYLKKHLDDFEACSLDDACRHVLKALASTTPQGEELTGKNVSLWYVGKDLPVAQVDEEKVVEHLTAISAAAAPAAEPAPMDTA